MSAILSSIPTTPFIEFMEKQQDAISKTNVSDNQDSFKGVEEFDMNFESVIPATEVFSELFKDLEPVEKKESVPQEETEHVEETKEVEAPSLPLVQVNLLGESVKHQNKIFMDASSSVDRSAAIDFREKCRSQEHTGQTSGIASGFVQANMVALPKRNAADFLEFVKANPQGCPLLGVTEVGDASMPTLGAGSNLMTDIPKYRIWKDGVLAEEVSDASNCWNDDMVGFLLGCSFTWEGVLKDAGYCPRHLEGVSGFGSKTAPMFKTSIPNVKRGPFGGEIVVSMRPYAAHELEEVFRITARYPDAHGSPIHWGEPSMIGVGNDVDVSDCKTDVERWNKILANPDFGDHVQLREGDIPVFWACGVTSQMSLMAAKLPFAVTHAPGHMFICDVTDAELARDV